MTENFRGLITDVVSPAKENGDFDREGFRRLLERAAAGGGAVLVNSIAAGEAVFMPGDAGREVLLEAMDALRGKAVLFAGVTGRSCAETAANIELLDRESAGGKYPGEIFLVDAPLCCRGNRGLSGYYSRLSESTRLPFILMNDPAAASAARSHLRRRNIRTSVLKKLSANPAVKGVAHRGSLNRSLNYIKAVRQRPDFLFYDADEINFLDSPGSDGVVSAGANICPEEWRQVVGASFGEDEKMKRSESYRLRLLEKREFLKEMNSAFRGAAALLVKSALKDMGIISSDRCFSPFGRAEEKKREKLISLLRELPGVKGASEGW